MGFWIIIVFFLGMYGFVIGLYRDNVERAKELHVKSKMAIWADVIDVKKVKKPEIGKKKYRSRPYFYIPTLRFDYNFETIEKECHRTNDSSNKYIVGKKVKIYVDPNNIDNMLFDDASLEDRLKSLRVFFGFFMVILTILLVAFIFVAFNGGLTVA